MTEDHLDDVLSVSGGPIATNANELLTQLSCELTRSRRADLLHVHVAFKSLCAPKNEEREGKNRQTGPSRR